MLFSETGKSSPMADFSTKLRKPLLWQNGLFWLVQKYFNQDLCRTRFMVCNEFTIVDTIQRRWWMLEPDRKRLVDLLHQQEMIIARLYKIFAASFAENAYSGTILPERKFGMLNWSADWFGPQKRIGLLSEREKSELKASWASLNMWKALKSIWEARLPIPWIWENRFLRKCFFPFWDNGPPHESGFEKAWEWNQRACRKG